jgi:glucosamine--fructose-6-phosphate aminotransferase (isomerizing)
MKCSSPRYPAILEHTRRVVFLESRQKAVVTQQGYEVTTLEGEKVAVQEHTVGWGSGLGGRRGEYRHFYAERNP